MTVLLKQGISIVEKIESAGFEAMIAGGAVRDYYLGKDPHDVDIATNAPFSVLNDLFPKIIPVGKNMQTVLVFLNEHPFEVTQFKGEDWYQDLAFRDFTCNAMALNSKWDILDPLHGRKHLQEGTLKAAGNAEAMFQADPVRLIRMIRFLTGFKLYPDEALKQAFRECAPLLQQTAKERIFAELDKLRIPVNEAAGWQLFIHYVNMLPLSILQSGQINKALVNFSKPLNRKTWWAVLLYGIEKSDPFLQSIPAKLNRHSRRVNLAVAAFPWTDREMYDLGEEVLLSAQVILGFLHVPHTEDYLCRYRSFPIHHRKELAVDGADLLHLEKAKIGKALKFLEYAVIENKAVNTREFLLAYLQEVFHPHEK